MFGKPLAYYVGLQAPVLIAILLVFLLRFFMATAGVPDSAGRTLSLTGVLILALPYYALVAKRHGLTFKHLYALSFIQGLFSQTLIAMAITLAVFTGNDNIYTVHEFYQAAQGMPPDGKNWLHATAHVIFAGALVLPVAGWAISSALLVIVRKVKSW